jgi:hypothetical protein
VISELASECGCNIAASYAFRDRRLPFNLTCFDLQLDSHDHNHLYVGTNRGHVVHCSKSGVKPAPQFYIPKGGECNLMLDLFFLYTSLWCELDITLFPFFSCQIILHSIITPIEQWFTSKSPTHMNHIWSKFQSSCSKILLSLFRVCHCDCEFRKLCWGA